MSVKLKHTLEAMSRRDAEARADELQAAHYRGYRAALTDARRKLTAELRETKTDTLEATSPAQREDCIYSAISLICSAEELGIIDPPAAELLSRWATTWRRK